MGFFLQISTWFDELLEGSLQHAQRIVKIFSCVHFLDTFFIFRQGSGGKLLCHWLPFPFHGWASPFEGWNHLDEGASGGGFALFGVGKGDSFGGEGDGDILLFVAGGGRFGAFGFLVEGGLVNKLSIRLIKVATFLEGGVEGEFLFAFEEVEESLAGVKVARIQAFFFPW